MIKLFIDDERFPPNDNSIWDIARSSQEAIDYIEKYTIPDYISFDHDLGGEDTSMVILKWLENKVLNKELIFPKGFSFYVHSQNPIGKENITHFLNNLIKHSS